MFKRLMQRACRAVVVRAQKAARMHIGHGQIPLGLRREPEGVAARAAESDNPTKLDCGGRHGPAARSDNASPPPEPPSTTELPDLARSSVEDLDQLIDQLVDEELAVSHRRRIVHAKLDILWAERENRPPRRQDLRS